MATSPAAFSTARQVARSLGRRSRIPRTALIGSVRGTHGLYVEMPNRPQRRARPFSIWRRMSPQVTALVQLVSLILALLALVMGAYLLIIGRRPWRNDEPEAVAPRVRLLGVSYILVFRTQTVQIIIQPRRVE